MCSGRESGWRPQRSRCGHVTLSQEPKTRRSRRTVPVARSIMRQVEERLSRYVDPDPDALVFTAPRGGPLARSLFARRVWQPAAVRAGLRGDHVPRPAAQLRGVLLSLLL